MDGVHIGQQAKGALRFTIGQQHFGGKAAQRVGGARVFQHGTDLRKNIVGIGVARVLQRRIAHRVPGFQAQRALAQAAIAGAGNGQGLRRDAHPDMAGAQDFFLQKLVVHVDVDVGRGVEPFDDDHPAEFLRVDGPAHQNPRFVRGGGRFHHRPFAVDSPGALGLESARGAFNEELLFRITGCLEVHHRGGGSKRTACLGSRAVDAGFGNQGIGIVGVSVTGTPQQRHGQGHQGRPSGIEFHRFPFRGFLQHPPCGCRKGQAGNCPGSGFQVTCKRPGADLATRSRSVCTCRRPGPKAVALKTAGFFFPAARNFYGPAALHSSSEKTR